MTKRTEYYLVVHTDSYTGNTDSFIQALLFKSCDGRYGSEDGTRLSLSDENIVEDIIETHPESEYDQAYNMVGDLNSLEFAVYKSCEELAKYFDSLYTGKTFQTEDNRVHFLGFSYKTKHIIEEIEETRV